MFSDRLTNRYGKFAISLRLMEENPDMIRSIMSKTIILKAECDYIHRSINYEAWSPEFEELNETELVPDYSVRMTQEFLEPVKVSFIRRDKSELSKTSVETGSESSEFHVPENRSKFGSLPRA